MNTRFSKHFWMVLLVGLRTVFICLMILCVVASGNILAASFVVDNLEDTDNGSLLYTAGDGTNTLRKCIRLSNNAGSDTITFSVSGTITVGSSLPDITDSGTIIDASSQWLGTWPSGDPGVTLDGGNIVADGIRIYRASNCAIRGLFITSFTDAGIDIYGGAQNNVIGGTTAGERNIISGNKEGVYISRSSTNSNYVKGNYIGTNADGTIALENTGNGVYIDLGSHDNIIGGTTISERNIISGNRRDGVNIQGINTNNNQIKGNYIGTNVTGNAALGNQGSGVSIAFAQSNIIGGTIAGERNIISGNHEGIYITSGTNNQVKGNYIGTNADGNAGLANIWGGVKIGAGAQSNIIGGTTAGERNVISGNRNESGVYIYGSSTNNNQVMGNYIGTNADGTYGSIDLKNSGGVHIATNAQSNIIGGPTENAGNKIAYNWEFCVKVEGSGTRFNTISHNSITGIALVNLGNDEILAPVGTSTLIGNNLNISGNRAGANATVEVFKSDYVSQITQYLGSLIADGSGKFSGTINVAGKGVIMADTIVLTTTHTDGNTSEFSLAINQNIAKIFLETGWNMVSFPGILITPSVNELVPPGSNIVTPFYTYDPTNFSYKEITEAKPGEGYWILSMAGETFNASVIPVTNLVLDLKAGWNMIGGVNGNVDFSDTQDDPDGSVIPPIYTYYPPLNLYYEKKTIEPGEGYWILALQDCQLGLKTIGAPAKKNTVELSKTTQPDWTVPIQISTSKVIKEMVLGIQSNASEDFDPYIDKAMPPQLGVDMAQPEVSFQIEDRLVNRLSRDIKRNGKKVMWKMYVESQSEDVELIWDPSLIPLEKDLYIQYESLEIDMREQRSIKLPSGKHVVTITLRDRIPEKTAVFQNYPNPFNPETWIPYQLSESGNVVVSIYDVSGRLVKKLDIGHKDAGIYISREKSAYWDGKNEVGEQVSSGVYFYQIQSGKFSKMMKLVIIR